MADSWLILGNGYIGGGVAACNPSEFYTVDHAGGASFQVDLELGVRELDEILGDYGFNSVLWAAPPLWSASQIGTLLTRHAVKNVVALSSAEVYAERALSTQAVREAAVIGGSAKADGWAQLESAFEIVRQSIIRPNVVTVRLFNVSGFNALTNFYPTEGVIGQLLEAIEYGDEFPVFGSRAKIPSRDYSHVLDVVATLLRIMGRMGAGERFPDVMNYGRGRPTDVRELIQLAKKFTEQPVDYALVGPKDGEPVELWPNTDLLDQRLPKQTFTVSDIVEDMWRNFNAVDR